LRAENERAGVDDRKTRRWQFGLVFIKNAYLTE
jgi:hypothetical protein